MKTLSSTVAFQDEAGNALANGSIILTLASGVYEIAAGGGQVVGQSVIINLDATGKISGTPQVWASDELTPQVPYTVTICGQKNGLSPIGYATWLLAGSSPIDLSQMVSTVAAPFALPGLIYQAPAGNQAIVQPVGTSLNVNRFENIRFADQFAAGSSTGGIQEAINDLGPGGILIIPPGTYDINSVITDAKGSYGLLLDQKAAITVIGYGATINYNVNNNSARVIEVRSSTHVVIEGLTIKSSNPNVGTAFAFRRPSNSDPGNQCTNNILRNVRINPANVTASAFNIGVEMGVTGEGQVSENKLEHIEINQCNTGILQDGGATETILYDHITVVGCQNSTLFDLRASSATLIVPVTGGSATGITHLKVSGTFRNVALVNPHFEVAQSANAADTAKAILWTTTQGLMEVFGGDFSDFRASGTSTLMDFSAGGAGGTIYFLNSVLFRSGGTANLVLQDGVGPYVTQFDGQWSNIAVTGMPTNLQHFIKQNLGNLAGNFSYAFDNGCIVSSEGAGTTSLTIKTPATYGGAPGSIVRFGHGFMQMVGGTPLQPDTDNTSQLGQSGTRFANAFLVNATIGTITSTTASRLQRIRLTQGTALVAGDFALSAGFGTTATVTAVLGTDQAWTITVTSSGTGQAANPTITLTFHDGTWTNSPITISKMTGGTGAVTQLTESPTATTNVITFQGTPSAGSTYVISSIAMGR